MTVQSEDQSHKCEGGKQNAWHFTESMWVKGKTVQVGKELAAMQAKASGAEMAKAETAAAPLT